MVPQIGRLVVLCSVVAALVLALIVTVFPAGVTFVEKFSAALALIDDLLVRILGILLLVLGGAGFLSLWHERDRETGSSMGKSEIASWDYFRLAKVGAAAALSGAAFLTGYELDALDDEGEMLLGRQEQAPETLARWVQIVADPSCRATDADQTANRFPDLACKPQSVVRGVVYEEEPCPRIQVEYRSAGQSQRRLQKQHIAPEWRRRFQQGFGGIKVCRLTLKHPAEIETVRFDDGKEIAFGDGWDLAEGPSRIAALGDTGCRDNEEQICDETRWRFTRVVDAIAQTQPDLVLHLGDLMYVKADTWEAWRDYFFDPADAVSSLAPWVVVRGNHERCGEYGDAPIGFYFFFGDSSELDCREQNELLPTYAVDLSASHRLVVADSSVAYQPERRPECKADNPACRKLTQAFGAAAKLAREDATTWLATHVPIFALEWNERTEAAFPQSSAMMLGLWRDQHYRNIDVVFSGDRHLLQVLPGNDERPLQITSGTGGVNLDMAPNGGGKESLNRPPEGQGWLSSNDRDEACSFPGFGFLLAERSAEGYQITFRPLEEEVLGKRSPCEHLLPPRKQ